MLGKLFIKTVAIGFVIMSIGCGNDTPTFSVLPSTYTYVNQQSQAITVNNKIDVLWVIDNSGSMAPAQANLAANFNNFISSFISKGYDFQLSVITTEAYLESIDSVTYSTFADFRSNAGMSIVDQNTPDIQSSFVTNATQGITGYGDERAFQSIREALNSNVNAGFIRPNSFLSVIIVSDEDDISHPGISYLSWMDPGLDPVSDYITFLDGITNSTANKRNYTVNGIITTDQACADSLTASGGFTIPVGLRYLDLINQTGGVAGSICDTQFDISLQAISENVVQQVSIIPLSELPVPESVVVVIDSVPLDNTSWSYDSVSNSIVFVAGYAPPQNAVIEIVFDSAVF